MTSENIDYHAEARLCFLPCLRPRVGLTAHGGHLTMARASAKPPAWLSVEDSTHLGELDSLLA